MVGYYLHEQSFATGHEVLSADKEKELIERFQNNDDQSAIETLVKKNQLLVRKFVERHKDWRGEWEDLYAAANEGLVIAIKRFDTKRGLKLSTYAIPWINERIQDLKEKKSIVHIPRSAQQRLNRELKSVDIEKDFDSLSCISKTAFQASWEYETLVKSLSCEEKFLSNDKCRICSFEQNHDVEILIKNLTENELRVISLRYGIYRDSPGMSLEKIGSLVGGSGFKVQQIVQRALEKMKQASEVMEEEG